MHQMRTFVAHFLLGGGGDMYLNSLVGYLQLLSRYLLLIVYYTCIIMLLLTYT